MARTLTRYWTRPGSRTADEAAATMWQYRRAIQGRVTWYEREYPGDVDWEPVIWDAAYKAAFFAYPGFFWAVFVKTVWMRTRNYVARHHRRVGKLVRWSLEDIDEPVW